jgi:hypothetical protein
MEVIVFKKNIPGGVENHYANLCSYNHTLFKHGRENERGGVDMIKRWDGMRVSHCIHRGCAAVRKGGVGAGGVEQAEIQH